MITSVRIQNFKSFRDVEVSLGPFNVLVGPNMSGKSNFFEAFKLLRRICFPSHPGVAGVQNAFPGGFHEHTWKGGQSNVMAIALRGDNPDPATGVGARWDYHLELIADERGAIRILRENLSLEDKQLIVPEAGYRSLVNKDGREVISHLDPARAAIEYDVPNWDGSFLRRMLASTYFYRLVPHLMRNINPTAAPPYLSEHGENLSAWLMHLQTRYPEAFASIRQVCQDVLPDLTDLFTWPTPQATVSLASKEKSLKRPVTVPDMSDGELVFIALLSVLLSPPDLRPAVCFVEELENHLHPRLIEVLVEILRQLQGESAPANGTQVIATTHSPHLVDRLRLEEVIVFQKRQGETIISYPRDKAHLRELLDNKDLGLGDLFYSGALLGE
jgi:predicted ATPase